MNTNILLPILVANCDGCGVCCMHMSSPPFDDDEVDELRENHPDVYADLEAAKESSRIRFQVTGLDPAPCGWFDMVTRKCRHDDFKPVVCMYFEVGNRSCIEQRRNAGIQELA